MKNRPTVYPVMGGYRDEEFRTLYGLFYDLVDARKKSLDLKKQWGDEYIFYVNAGMTIE